MVNQKIAKVRLQRFEPWGERGLSENQKQVGLSVHLRNPASDLCNLFRFDIIFSRPYP
jgi:hypothetical protein